MPAPPPSGCDDEPRPSDGADTSSESPRALTIVPPRRRSSDSWHFPGLREALAGLDKARDEAGLTTPLTEKDCEGMT